MTSHDFYRYFFVQKLHTLADPLIILDRIGLKKFEDHFILLSI